VLLHFSYCIQGSYSVQFLFEGPMDISIARKPCSYVQRRQAAVELQQCQPGAGTCWQRVQLAKVMISGRRDTRQLHEERGTESTRRNTNEKERNGGRGELWKQSRTNMENTETSLRNSEKSGMTQTQDSRPHILVFFMLGIFNYLFSEVSVCYRGNLSSYHRTNI